MSYTTHACLDPSISSFQSLFCIPMPFLIMVDEEKNSVVPLAQTHSIILASLPDPIVIRVLLSWGCLVLFLLSSSFFFLSSPPIKTREDVCASPFPFPPPHLVRLSPFDLTAPSFPHFGSCSAEPMYDRL